METVSGRAVRGEGVGPPQTGGFKDGGFKRLRMVDKAGDPVTLDSTAFIYLVLHCLLTRVGRQTTNRVTEGHEGMRGMDRGRKQGGMPGPRRAGNSMDEDKDAHQPQSKLCPGEGRAGQSLPLKEVSQLSLGSSCKDPPCRLPGCAK